jgi:outer membrane protein OmpA-like peptidoglycan-associated protein
MKSFLSFCFCACFYVFIAALSNPCYGKEAIKHPVVTPLPNSVLKMALSQKADFSSYVFRVEKNNKVAMVKKSGRFWKLHYVIENAQGRPDKNFSPTEIVANYKAAALEKGARIVYERSRGKLTFRLPNKSGVITWVYVAAGTGQYDLHIIEEAGFEKQLAFGAEALKKALYESGKISVYGINFDIDKANLQPGAEKIIVEIVKLMKSNPKLNIEIQGHTDNTGTTAHNLSLSQKRAKTVQKFLMLYGIDSSRIVPKGFGSSKPIATNDTQDGRAKNRRVALVKMD